MRYLNYLVGVLFAIVLAACGGGGGSAGTPSGGGGGGGTTPTPSVASIELLASGTTLGSASANNVTVTALVKNASNVGIASAPVSFAASSGVLQSVSATTDANGAATATLSSGADRSNRDVTVTVTSGGITKSMVLPVNGTAIAITGGGSMLLSGTGTYTVTVKDSGGNPLTGSTLTVASSLGNAVSPASVTTDTTGTATFNYVANKSGSDTLTVAGSGATATFAVAISSVDFAFTTPSPGTEVFVNSPRTVSVRYLSGGVGVAGQQVSFSTTRGTVSAATAVTDATGIASTNVSSTTAGPATVTAQIAGGAQTTLGIAFSASTPASIVLQINPGSIAPNATGSTANRAQLVAVVKDSSGNPVKGRTVNFTAIADASGGSIQTGTGVTDANGTVSDAFVSGAASTAANGVVIRATVASDPTITSTANLTVSRQSLFISIATSNTIANKDETLYSKPFSVIVNDANGAAVANQTVTLSIYPTTYIKGSLTYNGKLWVYGATIQGCANEDVNRDGTLQPGEDINNNLVLTPGSPGVVAASNVVAGGSTATVTTDASGAAGFVVIYGEQYAPWLVFEIAARASVAGTESKTIFNYTAVGVDSDFTSETVPPAGRISPFGTAASCAIAN